MPSNQYPETPVQVTEDQINAMASRLMSVIIDFRKEINITPIRCEPVYLNEAEELCTPGMTGHMVSSLITLQEQADKKDLVDWFDKHFSKVVVCVIILMIPLVYYLIMK